MNKNTNEFITNAAVKVTSIIPSQRFWELAHRLALLHMNIGSGWDYEKSGELKLARKIRKKYSNGTSLTIFDVGANVGGYSKRLSAIFGATDKIYSFEPSKATYNLMANTTMDCRNVIPNNIGFSDKEEQLTLYTNSDGSGLATVYPRVLEHYGDIRMDQTEVVELSTIDSFCASNNIGRIHFLKLDVEGHELKVLKGAEKMLAANRIDHIQFEFSGCNIDSRTYFRDFYYLLKDKYTIYRILRNGIHELWRYMDYYEVYITANYLAVSKELKN
ncbi:MAG: FkbM family methyltransferase [Bacteroidetes bacterium]|nr:FkbM family methyltransferase [Bacteroidota bacterium]